MTVFELVKQLAGIGARVSAEGDQVAVRFPEEHRREVEGLGPEIRRLKPELLRVLHDAGGRGSFDGFESRLDGDRDEVRGVRSSAECPPLPAGVKLVRYRPKEPPVAVAPISIVTDVDKFIQAYLRDLGHRLQHPATHSCAPLPEILAKLAEVGLELTLDGE
ncbi:MAG TPA: hypothetical protein VG204_00255 [Terriglobia bacterium]|nr:hypothetical protein [Terriglobia bacterium]